MTGIVFNQFMSLIVARYLIRDEYCHGHEMDEPKVRIRKYLLAGNREEGTVKKDGTKHSLHRDTQLTRGVLNKAGGCSSHTPRSHGSAVSGRVGQIPPV